ncbi:MAG: SNF2-related protein, partial [Nitrososphaera sp.]
MMTSQVEKLPAMGISLMAHQREALRVCDGAKVFGYLMGVGTGKTFTALEDAYQLYQRDRIGVLVIVAPRSLCGQWAHELDRYYNDKKDFNYKVSFRNKIVRLYSDKLSIFIVNTESFSRPGNKFVNQIKMLVDHEYLRTMVVLDESTKIKNIAAKRTKLITRIFWDCQYKRILTGTPITENAKDAY